MTRISNIASSLLANPSYTAMRGVARFQTLRNAAAIARQVTYAGQFRRYLDALEHGGARSLFSGLDRQSFADDLEKRGVAFGLKLPVRIVEQITDWAKNNVSYADRDVKLGFCLDDREEAQSKLKKPILVSQYFNTTRDCDAISQLANDPGLLWIAANYLKSPPTFVGANLWWTFPVDASEADRSKHAHVFHRDVDDFKFFKFFFYLTDVPPGEGAHVCVAGSHVNPPKRRLSDAWVIRRYDDGEIFETYPAEDILEICGEAGEGFAENTLCVHKGSTPRTEARLLLQLQFAMFDHGVMHDNRSLDSLEMV